MPDPNFLLMEVPDWIGGNPNEPTAAPFVESALPNGAYPPAILSPYERSRLALTESKSTKNPTYWLPLDSGKLTRQNRKKNYAVFPETARPYLCCGLEQSKRDPSIVKPRNPPYV
jgi:hypothetical protein